MGGGKRQYCDGLTAAPDLLARFRCPYARYRLFGPLIVVSRRQIVYDHLDQARRRRSAHCRWRVLGPPVPLRASADMIRFSS